MNQKHSEYEARLLDVARLALPSDKQIISKNDYSNRTVNWVSLLATREAIVDQVESGDIVLFPNSFQQEMSNKALLQFFKKVVSLDAAALVLFASLSSDIADDAHELDLPIYIMPEEANLRSVHRAITSFLLDRQNQMGERGMRLYRELTELSRDGQGLPLMAQRIGKLTEKIVVIQDKRLEILAIDRPATIIPVDDAMLLATITDQNELPAVLRNRKAAAKATRTHWQQTLFPQQGVSRLVSPIISGDRARGYLSIVAPSDDLDALDVIAVEQGAAAIALEMAKTKAVNQIKNELRGNFLEGILAGTVPIHEIDRLASRLDHDTDHPHAVMTFKWNGENDVIRLRRIESTLYWLLSTNNRPTLIHVYGGDHVAVFQALRNNEELAAATRLAHRLCTQLKADYPDDQLVSGISGPIDSLVNWPACHQQSLQAMEVGQRLGLDELVEYSSLGVYRLLGQLDDVEAVKEFCDQVIGSLVTYDSEHRSSLVQTMEEYFNHHGNVSQTAEALFIHRNTLLYRLERIQDLTNHDLNQSDMRLALHLALKLWQLGGGYQKQ